MLTNGLLADDHPAHEASTHANPYLDGRREGPAGPLTSA